MNLRAVVEPVDPFEGREFDRFKVAAWATTVDDFGLEQAVDCFGQCVVIAVASAAHGRFDAGIRQSFIVFDRQILAAPVAVVNEPHALGRSAFMDRQIEGIQNEPGMRGGADAPADDLARIGVDGEGGNPPRI